LSDLAPTGTKVTELPVDWAETVTPVKIGIDETADVALGFGGNEVGLVIEPNTFTETVDIAFTLFRSRRRLYPHRFGGHRLLHLPHRSEHSEIPGRKTQTASERRVTTGPLDIPRLSQFPLLH
jgi:hypothetical protein